MLVRVQYIPSELDQPRASMILRTKQRDEVYAGNSSLIRINSKLNQVFSFNFVFFFLMTSLNPSECRLIPTLIYLNPSKLHVAPRRNGIKRNLIMKTNTATTDIIACSKQASLSNHYHGTKKVDLKDTKF